MLKKLVVMIMVFVLCVGATVSAFAYTDEQVENLRVEDLEKMTDSQIYQIQYEQYIYIGPEETSYIMDRIPGFFENWTRDADMKSRMPDHWWKEHIEEAAGTGKMIIDGITIFIDDRRAIPIDAEPRIVNDRTFVPLRFISEKLGYKVDWDDKTKTVTVGSKFKHVVGTSYVTMSNGEKRDIGVNSFIDKNSSRTMVSIRLFSEAMGYRVEWSGVAQAVLIYTK